MKLRFLGCEDLKLLKENLDNHPKQSKLRYLNSLLRTALPKVLGYHKKGSKSCCKGHLLILIIAILLYFLQRYLHWLVHNSYIPFLIKEPNYSTLLLYPKFLLYHRLIQK